MNLSELIDDVATRSKTSRTRAKEDIEIVFAAISDALRRGEEVRIPGFGTFVVASRKASTGRNPRTGLPIAIAAKRFAKLRPGKHLTEQLNPPARQAAAERRRA